MTKYEWLTIMWLPLSQTHPLAHPIAWSFAALKPRRMAGFSAFWEPTLPQFGSSNPQRAGPPGLSSKRDLAGGLSLVILPRNVIPHFQAKASPLPLFQDHRLAHRLALDLKCCKPRCFGPFSERLDPTLSHIRDSKSLAGAPGLPYLKIYCV